MRCKKLMALLISIVFISGNVFALTIGDSESINASVAPTGGNKVWNADVKRIDNDDAADAFTWSGVTAGKDQYAIAEQYIELSADIVTEDWRMIIYTNNTNYTGDKSKGSFGLVRDDKTSEGLPLAWRVQDSSHTVTPVVDPVFSTSRPAPITDGFTDYAWKFVVDKNQTGTYAWDDTDTYVRVWDTDGFYWEEGVGTECPADSLDGTVYIYLAAGFHNSKPFQYSTTSLTIEVLQL